MGQKKWTVLTAKTGQNSNKKACKYLIAEYAKMKCDVRMVQQWFCKIKYHGGTAITAVITVWVFLQGISWLSNNLELYP